MIEVFVRGNATDVKGLVEFGVEAQERFRFVEKPAPDGVAQADMKNRVQLYLTNEITNNPFLVDRTRGVKVATTQSEGISHYLGISREAYLLLCSMLGLTQWRVLALNPLLRPEDFVHVEPATCAFTQQPYIQHYALTLEHRYICPACRDFFRCLGAELEILALQTLLRTSRPSIDLWLKEF